MKNNAPNIAFLGLTEKISKSFNVSKQFTSLNILNLRNEVISFIYPMNLASFNCLFAFYNFLNFNDVEIVCKTEKQGQIFNTKISLKTETVLPVKENIDSLELENSLQPENNLWTVQPIPFPADCILFEPERLDFFIKTEKSEVKIGQSHFFFAETPPLNEERILAIKSNPKAAKYFKVCFKCNTCESELIAIAGIDKPELKKNETWYEDLSDYFTCKCEKNSFSLQYIKKGITHYLGNPIGSKKAQYSFTKLYEKSTLISILERFKKLIYSNPEEERVQNFLEENTIFFHIFSPDRIINKASILQKYQTDFAVISNTGTLFLIEIEKPGKLILKKDGGRTSEFNHPFDQVTDWLHVMTEHRFTALEMLDINTKKISNIRGIVVYGTEKECNSEDLRKIKSSDFGQIDFYTFDDFAGNLETLINNYEDL